MEENQKKLFTAQREKTIPIKDITSVWVQKPDKWHVGYILFLTLVLTQEKMAELNYLVDTFWVAKNENSVFFEGNDKYELALRIKDHILELNPLVFIQ
jgi:hypothetical protein